MAGVVQVNQNTRPPAALGKSCRGWRNLLAGAGPARAYIR